MPEIKLLVTIGNVLKIKEISLSGFSSLVPCEIFVRVLQTKSLATSDGTVTLIHYQTRDERKFTYYLTFAP